MEMTFAEKMLIGYDKKHQCRYCKHCYVANGLPICLCKKVDEDQFYNPVQNCYDTFWYACIQENKCPHWKFTNKEPLIFWGDFSLLND